MSFHVVLFEPEIPPNTGNIIRLCANTHTVLHLIHPLGFAMDAKQLKRAGLDYREFAEVIEHNNYANYLQQAKPRRIFACTTKGQTNYSSVRYQDEDHLLFGPESRGLPPVILDQTVAEFKIRIPMQANSRSLNLSNAVAIILYEALRQCDFKPL